MAVASRERVTGTAVAPPLAVDLDGTLIKSDCLHEGLVNCIRLGPRAWWEMVAALGGGKAAFKRRVAESAPINPEAVPYNQPLIDFLRSERKSGRTIGLFTAADQTIADRIAGHLDLFDVVRGSDGATNLAGANKLAAIREEFGTRFAYAGDADADVPVFEGAESVILVGEVERLRRKLPPQVTIDSVFPRRRPGVRGVASALRLKHWMKNALVFVAPILGYQYASTNLFFAANALFLAMGCIASATYLLNDLLDLEADRQHTLKRHRLLAAGTMSARDGLLLAGLLFLLAFGLGLLLPAAVGATLGLYLATTLTYSFWLKRKPLVDVAILACLFTLRVIAGGFLLPTPQSPWLLTFSMLLFVGLAMIKRYTELDRAVQRGEAGVSARGYTARDLPLLLAAGVASAFAAIVIFMIYLINDQYPTGMYAHPERLWAMMPVILIWTLRIWHLTIHGRVHEDPVVFALRDRVSLTLAFVTALIFVGARF